MEADARIDLDMAEILTELTDGDLAGAMAKYRGGTNGVQTLASLSKPGASSMASDTWWPVYKAYWSSNNDYADTFVEDAYAGSLPDGMKKELIKKGIAYQGVWMYAAHLFDKGMRECVTKDWDRGVAHYIGELEGGTERGATIASTGHLLYNLAQKRCADFGTCATGTDSSTLADANKRVMNEHAVLGRDLLIQQKCTDARLATSFNSIISQMTVPLVQGMLKYAWKADPVQSGGSCASDAGKAEAAVSSACAKSWAEGWAFAAAVLPQVHKCDASAATKIKENLDIESTAGPMTGGVKAVKDAIESVYDCLGISCTDVGAYQASGTVFSGMSACTFAPSTDEGSTASGSNPSPMATDSAVSRAGAALAGAVAAAAFLA